jgi:tetratricopeptide (TPR) repeat protein
MKARQVGDRFTVLDRIFAAVVTAPPATRARVLTDACGGDVELEREVRALLEAHADAGAFLETPPPGARDGASPEAGMHGPLRFGAYESVRLIGSGGMGAVHLCKRVDDQFDKHVAVKVIHGWVATHEVVDGFEQERRVLAQLQHPNIAMLFDAGLTERGTPYIVMEYVDGRPLDVHCRELGLSIEDRLRLFLAVCEAVQAAHRSLIVHLDIKPGNILVTEDGLVKLVDFGISQLLDSRSTGLARPLASAFTPAYAAPEQIRGDAVSTATDVYALGAVLYRLLTDVRPFEGVRDDPIERTVVTQMPTPPSGAVHQEDEGGTSLRRRLQGELDMIVLKAMAKHPVDRYASPDALAADLRRYLDGYTVSAMPMTVRYRASRFVRRNRLPVFAAVLLGLSMSGGVAGVAWQAAEARRERDRAEKRFDDVRQLANVLLREVDEKLADTPGTIDARRAIVAAATDYLDSLAADVDDDPDLMLEVAGSYARLAGIQRNMMSADLGETRSALENHQQALKLRSRVLAMRPGDAAALRGLAESGVFLGDMLRSEGDLDGAVEAYRTSEERWAELFDAGVDDPIEALHTRAVLLTKIGIVEASRGEYQTAEIAYDAALALNERVLAMDATRVKNLRNKAVNLERIGDVRSVRGDAEGAYAMFLSAHAIYEELVAQDPMSTQPKFTLAVSHSKIGEVRGHPSYANLGDLEGALQSFRAGHAIASDLLQADPDDARAQMFTSFFDRRIGTLLALRGDLDEALVHQVRAHDAAVAVLDQNPTDLRALTDVASVRMTVADTLGEMDRLDDALQWRDDAISSQRAALLVNDSLIDVRQELAVALRKAGDCLLQMYERDQTRRELLQLAHQRITESVSHLLLLKRMAGDADAIEQELAASQERLETCEVRLAVMQRDVR